VDIAEMFCEVGDDCIPECPYSFQGGTEDAAVATMAFKRKYGEEV
jgi:hypothetical protein